MANPKPIRKGLAGSYSRATLHPCLSASSRARLGGGLVIQGVQVPTVKFYPMDPM